MRKYIFIDSAFEDTGLLIVYTVIAIVGLGVIEWAIWGPL